MYLAEFLAALADPVRLGALRIVWSDGEHCVCELMERLGASQSRMSRHMKVLRQAGVVLDRRDRQWVRYRRNPDLSPELTAIVEAVLRAGPAAEDARALAQAKGARAGAQTGVEGGAAR
ncbi:ArsR/SmtB family transcription factor [Oceanicella actignis]|uniref:ArsR/SmtB family transcription factor n=1 Tax=Oceanicella actignis TaxID=1189325 RepID=UPI0011E7D435|nr:ArsR family transcriptional regulator [Oceanicella actignis]